MVPHPHTLLNQTRHCNVRTSANTKKASEYSHPSGRIDKETLRKSKEQCTRDFAARNTCKCAGHKHSGRRRAVGTPNNIDVSCVCVCVRKSVCWYTHSPGRQHGILRLVFVLHSLVSCRYSSFVHGKSVDVCGTFRMKRFEISTVMSLAVRCGWHFVMVIVVGRFNARLNEVGITTAYTYVW